MISLNSDWLQTDGTYCCPFCHMKYSKKGICSHILFAHDTDGRKRMFDRVRNFDHTKKREFKPWNTGLTKQTDERVRDYAIKISKTLTGRPVHLQTDAAKKKLSQHAIRRQLGGHTSKMQIYYHMKNGSEVYLQSSYEIKVAESLDKNSIEWSRPTYHLWNDKNNISHRYYPDFYLPEYDVYLDPKNNYLQIKDEEKIKQVCIQNNIRIIVLSETELEWNTIKEKILPS